MSTTLQDNMEEIAILSRLYKVTSKVALLENQLESARAELAKSKGELEAARNKIEMLTRDLNTLQAGRPERLDA